VNILVHNNSLDSLLVLPLTLEKTLDAGEPPATLPSVFALMQNYPNPFNPSTRVEFDLPNTAYTTLRIYNLLGQEVAAPLSSQLPAGRHVIDVNMNSMPSGVYLYRLESGSFAETRKLVLMK
jgi:hypothetical protein